LLLLLGGLLWLACHRPPCQRQIPALLLLLVLLQGWVLQQAL
jgi:hypothetical protein